ncbi:hypothetical protein [Mycobacteroides sp. LB1]|uniref:antitoxin VbhA family protein n=1 Tax=Mycobacteroides sp. LB1 TaxID=2750814 RepID=UPI0015DEC418|nr:hypothetical protein [Mycobacteroides sp. LB1]
MQQTGGHDRGAHTQRRLKALSVIRRGTELEGSRSTDAIRAGQNAYLRGDIGAGELLERIRRRYNAQ